MLHLDLPTGDDLAALARRRHDPSVSIVLPTTPITPDTDVDRLAFRALCGEAIAKLQTTRGPGGAGLPFEAVQSLMVDMDRVMNGRIDETAGRIDEAETAGADSYGVCDEIARRVLLSGGEVLGVRQADLPEGAAVAAILRYAL